jgi:hypothetical protein
MAILRLPSSSAVLPGLPMMAAFGIFDYDAAYPGAGVLR